MIKASFTDFKRRMSKYLAKVNLDHETLLIDRGSKNSVVIMSIEEYNSLLTTNYELSSKKSEYRLDSAIESFYNGKSFEKII